MTVHISPRITDAEQDRSAMPSTPPVDWRRVSGPLAVGALLLSMFGAVGETVGTVIVGRLAENPGMTLLIGLAICVVGGVLLDSVGRVIWVGVVDRAEGKLREDLLDAALDQPLEVLTEQAVGEILDRVDDDTHDVGTLMRRQVWNAARLVFGVLPMWIVAGTTWWPAWFAFPLTAVAVWLAVHRLLPLVSRRKVVEEMAWTDHAAAFEESIAARNDLRTSLGQAYAIRRTTELAAEVHRKLRATLAPQVRIPFRSGFLLHGLLAAMGMVGVAMVVGGDLSVADLVTMFLVTTLFVGSIEDIARQLPDLQAGIGALIRIRQLHEAPREPRGGAAAPTDAPELRLQDLNFSYGGEFSLEHIDLVVPAGQTLALVGRSGSGKSTIAGLVSRAHEPPRGSVFLNGVDVCDTDLQQLRRSVGVVTQRTEIVAGTLAENIALFTELDLAVIAEAVAELGLSEWVAGLPDGLQTALGPGGATLSAGEEQLVAFARLLVRDVQLVVLDEATARMDPRTEAMVVRASERLLRGRTGVLIAHRLSTTARADRVAVMADGRVVQEGTLAEVTGRGGAFRDLLRAAGDLEASVGDEPGHRPDHDQRDGHQTDDDQPDGPQPDDDQPDGPQPDDDQAAGAQSNGHHPGNNQAASTTPVTTAIGGIRRFDTPPPSRRPGPGPSLARGVLSMLQVRPWWGALGGLLFLIASISGAFGGVTAYLWGQIVQSLPGQPPSPLMIIAFVGSLLLSPVAMFFAMSRYPRWWIEILLRVRASVLIGQTEQHRLPADPPGEVAARAFDADRYARYADRWVDFVNAFVVVVLTSILGGSLLAGGVLLAVMIISATASLLGRPVAGRSAAKAAAARAGFGRVLVSVLDAARTVKLAAVIPAVRRHLREVDHGRVEDAVREHRVQAALDSVPMVVVQLGVVTAWVIYFLGGWDLATALLVSTAVAGFDYFGLVVGWVITEAPGTRAWQKATATFAGGRDLVRLPRQIDLVSGRSPDPAPTPTPVALQKLRLRDFDAIHDDGTIGVEGVDLEIAKGQLVLVVGQVGSGKSSLLAAVAGLVDHRGSLTWNDQQVTDPEEFLRPVQVGYVGQVPRVLSGSVADNIALDHDRPIEGPIRAARLGHDVRVAGGPESLVGHRGVRLSGGQVQRLALACALATESQLLVADDVSSALDAATELELWEGLVDQGVTVLGSTSKRAALARADLVVVLDRGRVVARGPWSELSADWGQLAG
ncbi:ATP-binding cassette domain-containing protein [Naumannella halotolerans]|nr:ABC transporter ATP-binding protein [Naumannella halotolerans]